MLSPRSARRLGALVFTASVTLGAPLAAQAKAPGSAGADAARNAYFAGDVGKALKLAQDAGEDWIGGLSAFRLKRYAEAEASFDKLAHDSRMSPGVRAGGAFWAYRSADAAGHDAKAAEELKLAADAPHTFYGMMAVRKMKLEAQDAAGARPKAWIARLPAPALKPDGGFTVEKALVYAIVQKESGFRANAHGGGAVGLMQLMPATAAKYGKGSLTDPGANLRLGQAYLTRLLTNAKGDVMRALAGWNTGATPKAMDGDSLLAMESTPGASVRSFVQTVMMNYWGYQHVFGSDASAEAGKAAGAAAAG